MSRPRRHRIGRAIIAGIVVLAACTSTDTGGDDLSGASAPTPTGAAADSDEVVVLPPGLVRGEGLTEVDITDQISDGAVALRYDLPTDADAYLLDESASPVESILVGSLDSASGVLLIGGLDDARTLQVDTNGAWTVQFVDEVAADVLDDVIDGSGNTVVRLGDSVVDVVVEATGCPSGIELSSWGADDQFLSAELFVDDELPATVTPPNGTVFLNVRGPCGWVLTAR